MERITGRWPCGLANYSEGHLPDVINRLAAIEDILGNTYDLDRLRELVEADSECLPYVVGGETYTLHAGSCFLIRPGERTLYTADRKDPWEYMWVAFDGFDVLEILRRTGLVNRYVVAVENGEEFARYLREMIEEFSGGSLFKVMSCFYGAMSVLEKSAHGGAYTREHEYVNKAIGYIKSNYGYPIQVSDLARYIGIDRTYLYRIFFASESMSPKQYLMQVRINAAKKMLLSGAYTVGETALSCGFSDASSFCSRFKRCTGMTPKEFIADNQKHRADE